MATLTSPSDASPKTTKLSFYEGLHMRHRLWRYRFTSEEWHNIRYLLRTGVPGTTMLDIGANHGTYSYYMSKIAGPQGRVFAFEAQPELGPHLEAVKKTYRLDNLTIINKGLSSTAGVLKMNRTKAGDGAARFGSAPGENYETLEVPVITLDGFLEANEHSPISFIKCDVEKHELEVLRGGEQTLIRDMPTLLFEGHHEAVQSSGIFEFLTGLGYDGYFFFIDPSDHAGPIRRRRGRFVHFSEYQDYPYIKPTAFHRDYIFLKKGLAPA